jgi:hypothetical protein
MGIFLFDVSKHIFNMVRPKNTPVDSIHTYVVRPKKYSGIDIQLDAALFGLADHGGLVGNGS